MGNLRPCYRIFLIGGLFVGAILNLFALGAAAAGETARIPASLAKLAAPDLRNAVQNSAHQPVYLPLPPSNGPGLMNAQQRVAENQSLKLPAYPNSFPPQILRVRTQNWDE